MSHTVSSPAPSSQTPWHQVEATAAADRIGTDVTQGLSSSEVARRQQQDGFNELTGKTGRSPHPDRASVG